MKRHIFIMTLVAGGLAMAMLSACHRSNDRNTGMEEPSSVAQVNSEKIQPEQLDNLADIRRPDVKIHVKRGQTLAMQTEGLTLTAVDAAVQHEADYSITSLVSEDLPPLPQGMMPKALELPTRPFATSLTVPSPPTATTTRATATR